MINDQWTQREAERGIAAVYRLLAAEGRRQRRRPEPVNGDYKPEVGETAVGGVERPTG